MTSLFSYIRHRYDKLKGDASHSHPKESEIRQKLKKELYEYNQVIQHGFPTKPSALAYDPKLKLLAIGTKSGALRIVGNPGVEFSAENESGETITQLMFLQEQGRLISLTIDNVLHLWEINSDDFNSKLEEKKTFEDSNMKTISALCLPGMDYLLIGTEGGDVHILSLNSFKLRDDTITQTALLADVAEDFKVNPGAVEVIKSRPNHPDQVLIGFNRGLLVLWNISDKRAVASFNTTQQLEAATWNSAGDEFMTSHFDGSHMKWSVEDPSQPKDQATMPYGPFPCRPISHIEWKSVDGAPDSEPMLVFAGGMPRSNYGDKYCVTVQHGEKQVAFDFTSRIVDMVLVCTADDREPASEQNGEEGTNTGGDRPHTLVVLLEEELVAIDLLTPNWPPYRLPYLNSIHASAITASTHVSNIPESLWKKIIDAGNLQYQSFSKRAWPITGGERAISTAPVSRDLLITGHEDGSVKFWDTSSVSMELIYKVNTARYFVEGFTEQDDAMGIRDPIAEEEDEWPPFRKVGHFDPYTDDPRLGVQRIFLCPVSDILVVAGTAGQVTVLQMEREEREHDIKTSKANLVGDRDNFVWKGHEALGVIDGDNKYSPGFQPQCVLQISPPAATTALAVHAEWQLLSVGTAHGFCLFDFCQRHTISVTCTLSVTENTATDDSSMSRRKSFKKSLRESFRRLRRRRSMNKSKKGGDNPVTQAKLAEIKNEGNTPNRAISPRGPGRKLQPPSAIEEDIPHAERAIEERGVGDKEGLNCSMVRCLHFADTYLIPTVHGPSLLAGTNSGKIYIFSITLPAYDKRDQEDVTAKISKEITLRHQAPVISLIVLDGFYYPLPQALEVQNGRAKAPDMTANHRLLVISEEQFKIFSLPTLKPEEKWKLTAHEGQRTRKVQACSFRSRSDEQYSEIDVACVTNLGQMAVYTIKGLKRQLNVDVINKTDINGIASCLFTTSGEGFYQNSSSEYTRFTLSAARIIRPACKLNLKQQYRTPLGTPQIIVENYDETHPSNTLPETTAANSTSVDQSFASADMTQDDVRDYVTSNGGTAGSGEDRDIDAAVAQSTDGNQSGQPSFS